MSLSGLEEVTYMSALQECICVVSQLLVDIIDDVQGQSKE
jgi:hypothetical protein